MGDHPNVSAGLLGATVVLTALNLRSAVTSVGAVLRDVQAGLGMSDTVAGVLTTLPVLAFGVVGLLAAAIARRIGITRALVAALVLLTVGLAVRAFAPGVGWFLVTTLIALTGMAVGNVLVPVVVKAWFPGRVGRLTALYSTAVLLGTALPAAVTVPLAEQLGGWRQGIGVWAVPAALALLPWMLIGLRTRSRDDGPELPVRPADADRAARARVVRRRKESWALMVYFGLQSLEAYVIMGWLPTIFQDAGIDPARAGLLTSLVMGLSIPVALVVPALAVRRPEQGGWVIAFGVCSMAGYLGLLLAPGELPVVWSVLLGIGLAAFPLALLMIGLRARTSEGTSALSSLVQGYGYLLAMLGPLTVGILHDLTGGWNVPIGALLVLVLPKLVAGTVAARAVHVDDLPEPAGSGPGGR